MTVAVEEASKESAGSGRLRSRHLIGLEHITAEEITTILDNAEGMKEIFTRSVKKVPALRGKTVVNLFFEPSTRTRHSFDFAAKRLSADVVNVQVATSSVKKGESILDTVRTIEAMTSDVIVVRHKSSGVPQMLAKTVRSAVINAGDGCHEHPTQGLLDLYTIREKKGRIAGLNVVVVGDIRHSRVARSNIYGLTRMGAHVTLCGPPTLIPPGIEELSDPNGTLKITYNLNEAVKGADVVNMLRIQSERITHHLFPSIREYHRFFGLTQERLTLAKPDCTVMHPGPMNRGVEIDQEVADGPQSVITEQVTNGIAVRMAVLYLLAGGGPREAED